MPNGRNGAQPQARLGRCSIVLAVIAALLLVAGTAGLIMVRNEAGTSSSAAVLVTVAAFWLSRLANLIGVVLGVIGISRRDVYLGAVGLAINVAMIFGGEWLIAQFAPLFAGADRR